MTRYEKDFYQWRIQEWSYWHRPIVSKALDSFKRKSFNVHSLAFSVRSPAFRDQRLESSVQSPVFTVQRPESSVQLLRPESRNPGMPSHGVLISICLIFCQFQSGVAYKSQSAAYKKFLIPWGVIIFQLIYRKKLKHPEIFSRIHTQKRDMVEHELRVTSWKLKTTSWISKVWIQIYELRVQIYEFKFTSYESNFSSYEFKFMSYEFKSTSYEFKSTSYELKFTSYEFKSTSYELKFTSYEFKSMSNEFKSTSSRIT